MSNETKPYRCRGYLFCVHELLGLSIPEIANELGVSCTTIWYWLRNTEQRKKTIIHCEYCGKSISYNKNDCILKITNIEQNPTVLYFCRKECRSNFINNVQKRD